MMVKPSAPGVYTATYSNIPVYEFQFGEGLKEHVMRRRHDDWINATHILKAAGFDKPARTRILEREVQKDVHEKVQGGYGKYQGTWIPLENGQALAQRNNIYDKLRPIFEFTPGNDSPPPAPKHTTNKPKVPKKPAVPKWGNMPAPRMVDDYDNISTQLNDDESMADDATVASASFMGDDDRYDMSAQSTGHRKRKREEQARDSHEQAHLIWADELLDYFMTTHQAPPGTVPKPEPPPNFDANFPVDNDRNNGLHWSASMGDVEAMKQMKRFGADLGARNDRGETPLIRAILFTNSFEKQTMPAVVKELSGTLDHVDNFGGSALHHAANITMSKNKNQCARYYLDVILNKMQEAMEPEAFANLIDAQDINGDTALHLAARNKARKCVRALMGRGASVDIANNEGDTAQDLITVLNVERINNRYKAASSSPFAPAHNDNVPDDPNYNSRHTVSHLSEAAMTIENKITPILLEKMRELAASFDDELNQQDEAEKNAKMILAKTQLEHSQLREEALEWEMQENDPETERRSKAELAKYERNVTSIVEQQQQIQLNFLVQEESKQNGYMYDNQDKDVDMAERLQLAKLLLEEERKRKGLVVQYVQGLARAGTGEKGEKYRRLISKAVDKDPEMVDEALDGLLAELKDERASRAAEVVEGGGEGGY